jgi:outer membrane receptor protein involved in Fe transport
LQSIWNGTLAGHDNQLTVGVSHDQSDVDFTASSELGSLDATRLAIPGGVLLGDSFTGLEAGLQTTGLYFSSTLSLGQASTLTLSGRYNRANVVLEDQRGDALNGDHTFERFNPALGFTTDLGERIGFYAGYSEANRAPSPVELTCADEDDPCRLPNAFLADPPLEQVVARTLETGLRGSFAGGRWHAGIFRTTSDDDILFISAGAFTNEGYFDNVGETRREGLELELTGRGAGRTSWFVSFTQLQATFRSAFAVPTPNHPAALDGEIDVAVGDRLPLIPERLLKAGLRVQATDDLTIGADVLAASSQYFRGDEGNLVEPIDGYAVLNVRAEYRIGEATRFFINVENLLDEEYATFGVFGEADEVLGEEFADPRFLGPGAPRAAYVGVRVEF